MRYILLSLSILFAFNAAAQSNAPTDLMLQRTQDRISRIEKDLNMLQKEFYKQDTNPRISSKSEIKNSPSIDVRLTELEEQMRDLNGKIEQTGFSIKSLSKKMDKLGADIDFRMSNIEKSNQMQKFSEKAARESKPQEIVKKMEETSLDSQVITSDTNSYDEAFQYLRKSDYANAENSLKKYIESEKDNSSNQLLSNAYYWLGETYYVRENYEQAAVNFLKGYKGWSKGNKAADNLMKLAMALDKMNKKKEACTTFKKVLSEFPAADKSIKDTVEKEQTRISCN